MPLILKHQLTCVVYRNLWTLTIPFCVCILFIHTNTHAQTQQPPKTSAQRITEDIVIDGYLNELEWQKVEPIRNIYQIQPNEGEPVTQPTEVRILYDSKKIYFGFIFYDSETDKLVANEMRRDATGLRSNDYGFLLLDTYNDRRNAVFFRFTPLGGMEDGAVSNSGDTRNTSWDIVWECRCSINADEPSNWIAELAIPFSQLRFEQNEVMTWGINFGREIARNNELGAWHPAPKTYGPLGKYRTAYFGSLEGLQGIVPSNQIEILPYMLGGLSQTTSENSTKGVFEAGLDLKYSFTPNLTGDFTYNTDFAQVESDELQVNLTRFSLFYDEQRPFFLEGAGIFDVGIPRPSFRRPPPLLLFYSRRIGLANERAIPILAGGKITGKIGSNDIGLLNIYTNEYQDDEVNEPRTNYSVLRLNRDILKNSSVGAILINKQDSHSYNRTTGIDFSYRPFRTVDIQGLWTRSFDSISTGNPHAYYLGSEWRTNSIQLNGSYTDIGEDYNPEVGYVRRRGIRRLRGNAFYTPWPRKYGIRTIEIGPEVDLVLTQENNLESRDISFETQFSFESGENFSLQVRNTTEHLTSDFPIQGVDILAGNYDFNVFQTTFSTSSSRRIYGSVRIELGEYYDGSRQGLAIDTTLKPTVRLSIQPTVEFNRIKLPNNEFDANVFGGRIGYSFSTTLFTKMFVQWSSDKEVLSTNFLVNYIYRPGSDIYLVINQNYDTHKDSIEPLDWTIIGKITYWWNL